MKLMKKLIYLVMLLLLFLLMTPQMSPTVNAAEKTYLNYKGQGDSSKVFRFRMKEYTLYKGESVYLFEMYTSRYWDVMPDMKDTSSNKKVVTITDGKLKAVGTGTATITSSYSINKKKYSFKTKVKVIASDESTSKDKFEYDLNNGEIRITSLRSKVKNLVVPKYISGYRVTYIDSNAFLETNIKSAVISEGILDMGYGIFYGCNSLETVKIAAKISNLPAETFENCLKLKSVELPSTVKKIGTEAFYSCKKLQNISGTNVEVVEKDAFSECESLITFSFPKLKSIGEYGFAFSGIETISDLKYLETIGESAFEYCEKLKSVGNFDNIKVIDNFAFMGCTLMESIGLSDKLTKIGRRALEDCAITSLKIPDTLTYIEEYSLPNRLAYLDYNKEIKRTGVTSFFEKMEIIDSALTEMQITEDDNELEKIRKVHDWIVKNVSYSLNNFFKALDEEGTLDLGYVALKSRFAICSAYSEAFRVFMDRLGIECILVDSSKMNHQWNMVKLDDGFWYHIDVTWDDPGESDVWQKGHLNYYHLVCTDEQIGKDHSGWQKEGVPKANGTKYADYFDHTYYVRFQ